MLDKRSLKSLLMEQFGAALAVKGIRAMKKEPYHFQAAYEPITGTRRRCFIHPKNVATHFEVNTQDKSYRRPVCAGCVA